MVSSARPRPQATAPTRPQGLGRWQALLIYFCVAAPAGLLGAGELVYHPSNPAFGGSPLNSNHLLGTANAQNDFTAPTPGGRTDPNDLFVRQLQARLLSGLSERVAQAILGNGANSDFGDATLGDQSIHWEKVGNDIVLTITNLLTGDITTIKVPDLPDLTPPPAAPQAPMTSSSLATGLPTIR